METKQIFLNVQRKQAERLLKRYSEHSESRPDDQFIPGFIQPFGQSRFSKGIDDQKALPNLSLAEASCDSRAKI